MEVIEGAGLFTGGAAVAPPHRGVAPHWVEHLRVADLSVGTYSLPAGSVDDQTPHGEDEIYVVTTGRARMTTPTSGVDVRPGTVIFVPAGEVHHFVDVTEDLAVLVVFAPAEGSRAPSD